MTGHLLESTLFAAAAALVAFALRSNRARVRYWVWLAASLKFLFPFALLVDLGSRIPWRSAPPSPPPAALSLPKVAAPESVPQLLSAAPIVPHAAPFDWAPLLWTFWAAGFAVVLISWLVRWRRLHIAVESATPLELPIPIAAYSSSQFSEPAVWGIFHPVLLLPEGIAGRLSAEQLDAVVRHELCHVRRCDNLAGLFHMAVAAVFWFHPAVWWIGSRLVAERERACDEEVLLGGCRSATYADAILRVCELCVESPVPCVSGVSGANLTERIEAIAANRVGRGLNGLRKAALSSALLAALAAPLFLGLLRAPYLHAQSEVAAKFAVASIKPCEDSADAGPGKKGGGGGSGGFHWTPDRLSVRCITVDNLIRDAYLSYPEGKRWAAATSLEPTPEAFGVQYGGGCLYCGRGVAPVSYREFQKPIPGTPGWASSERYTIDAKAEQPTTPEMLRGPMMQALLEERFQLKLRRAPKEIPVYELAIAAGGPKLQPSAESSCFAGPPPSRRGGNDSAPVRICGRGGVLTQGGNDFFSPGTTIARLCMNLSQYLDRDVVDKTGIAGVYDIRLDAHIVTFPDLSPTPPAADMPPRPPEYDRPANFKVFQAALAKIGLKLQPARGTITGLVVEHVERPSGN